MTPSKSSAPVPPDTSTWESEGGSLAPRKISTLPDGVIPVPVTHYRVGPYTYTNLDDAMDQYRRQRPQGT